MQRKQHDSEAENRIEKNIHKGIKHYNSGEYQLAADQFLLAYTDLESKSVHDPVSEYQWIHCRYMLTLCNYFSGLDSHQEAKNKLSILLGLYKLFLTKPLPKKISAIALEEYEYLKNQLELFDEDEERAAAFCHQAHFYSSLIIDKKIADQKIIDLCEEGFRLINQAKKLTQSSPPSRKRAEQLEAFFHETIADYYVDQFTLANIKSISLIADAISHYEKSIEIHMLDNGSAELDLLFSFIHANELLQELEADKDCPPKLLENLLERFNLENQIAALPDTTEQEKNNKAYYSNLYQSHLDYAIQIHDAYKKREKRKRDEEETAQFTTTKEPAAKRIKLNDSALSTTSRDSATSSSPSISTSASIPQSSHPQPPMLSSQTFSLFSEITPADLSSLATRPIRKLLQFSAKLSTLDYSAVLCAIASHFLSTLRQTEKNDRLAHAVILLYESVHILSPMSLELDGNLHSAHIYFNENYPELVDRMAAHPDETTYQRKKRYWNDHHRLGDREFSLASLTKFVSRLHEALADQFVSQQIAMLQHLVKSTPIITAMKKLSNEEVKSVRGAFTASLDALEKSAPSTRPTKLMLK